MSHIFISYSHKDKKYVEKLEQKLKDEGFEVWIDHRIDYGDEWVKTIQSYLDECDAFIIVMSNSSFESEMVQNEVTRAREMKKAIFPILLDGGNWLVVQAKQYVDVHDGSLPNEKFYKRLEKVTPRNKVKPKPEPNHDPPPPDPEPVPPKPPLKWVKPVSIALSILILIAFVLLLQSANPDRRAFVNPVELSNFVVSYLPNAEFDKKVISQNATIYISVYLNEEQAVGDYEARWYYRVYFLEIDRYFMFSKDRDRTSMIGEKIDFELSPPHLPGEYRVDILRGDKLIATKYFSVK